jgi:glycosyltransferase involved in cell wall biosynthesis|tara:strand:- start:2716 stop:3408 length:693 start_codon:yes stop_codon:yes gene_type:complete
MKLSIIIPCFNEEKTIEQVVNKVLKFNTLEKEILIIDDCSVDDSREIIKKISNLNTSVKCFFQDKNQGKGSAIRKGFEVATGDILLIQDADLEYDPSDYDKLILPFLEADADVVYGSRFLGGKYVRLHFFWHYVANKILTLITNIVTNLNMTDMETGYKLFKKKTIESITLKENSFSIEPEITVKLAKKGYSFYEVPISYRGRSYQEGKKITLKDAFIAIYCIIKYRFFD